jgi:hypothetical protein
MQIIVAEQRQVSIAGMRAGGNAGRIRALFLVGKSGPEAPGDWKVARTRGQECPRYVAQRSVRLRFTSARQGSSALPEWDGGQ